MTGFMTLDDCRPEGLRVLLRVDLNVPMQDGVITDTTRIDRIVPTVAELAGRGAKVAVLSHFGRPAGRPDPSLSLAPLSDILERALDGVRVRFAPDCIGPAARDIVDSMENGSVALCENLRFHAGEEANDPAFCQALAELGDIYVNDGFSVSHRAHASVDGLARLRPAYAGRLMQAELQALALALERPKKPVLAIVGGAKVSTKLAVLANLVDRVDRLIIGGGMANTFLFAQGASIGASLAERDLADEVRKLETEARNRNCAILLQSDAVAAPALARNVATSVTPAGAIPDGFMALDAGPASIRQFADAVSECRTVLWNGPLGAFEVPPFDCATKTIARHVAERTKAGNLVSVAGGGETVAALTEAGVHNDFTYLSTAGGAFLEWLKGKDLPGVAALRREA